MEGFGSFSGSSEVDKSLFTDTSDGMVKRGKGGWVKGVEKGEKNGD